MKTPIVFFTSVTFLIGTLLISYPDNWNECLKNTNAKSFVKKKDSLPGEIYCDGIKFTTYPNIGNLENKEFAKLITDVPKIKIKSPYGVGPKSFMDEKFEQLLSKEINKLKFTNDGLVDFNTRQDGYKTDWSVITILPSNGRFISLLMVCWEKELDPPPSLGYYLCTFDKRGNLISVAYAGGGEEYRKSAFNKENLSFISGRIYCLNTDRPVIRKAKSWNLRRYEDNSTSLDLEVKEISYSINEQGVIKTEGEKAIFARTHVQWKDRAKVSFYPESDTIKKLLGERE